MLTLFELVASFHYQYRLLQLNECVSQSRSWKLVSIHMKHLSWSFSPAYEDGATCQWSGVENTFFFLLSPPFFLVQVDFASTFLDTPGEFISIWSEATTLTWSEVQSAAPIFATMGGILALALLSAGFGWRFDQKVGR